MSLLLIALQVIALGLASFALLWVLYLAVMNLQRARDAGTLSPTARFLGTVLLYIGLVADFLVNVAPVSVLFLEPPREYLVTQRLTRHANTVGGWRKRLALWFAKNLLDPFDPSGQHVRIDVEHRPDRN
ncbi:hypothetical protein [Duganella sp. CF458]|uniref:hypothetical protein n=1 Tax=Duganella sp. CF458 TaxID=1884368 RepID=UPI00147DEA56|nr:hypothetical protein [Duganella sp. CF458]